MATRATTPPSKAKAGLLAEAAPVKVLTGAGLAEVATGATVVDGTGATQTDEETGAGA